MILKMVTKFSEERTVYAQGNIKFVESRTAMDEECEFCKTRMQKVFFNKGNTVLVCKCKKFFDIYATYYPCSYLRIIGFFDGKTKYSDANFSMLLATQKSAYHAYSKFKDSDKFRFLILNGSVGTGKTYFSKAAVRDLLTSGIDQHDILFLEEETYFSILKNNMDKNTKNTDVEGKIDECKWFFFDDLGTSSKTLSEGWGKQKIASLVERVYTSNKKMLVTTNLTEKDILDLLGLRTESRLKDAIVIDLFGEDMRKNDRLSV